MGTDRQGYGIVAGIRRSGITLIPFFGLSDNAGNTSTL
jgi:hypothetical protein